MSDSQRPDEDDIDDGDDAGEFEDTEIEVLPVTRWDLGSVTEEYIVFRPHVLTEPDQDEDDAEATNYYALTPLQVRELAEQLIELLQDFDGEDDDEDDEDDPDADGAERADRPASSRQ